MRSLFAAIALLIATTSSAQNQTFEIYPGKYSYTSRGNLGTGSGELLMGLHGSHWRGLGDTGSKCEVTQLGLLVQDQNWSTQESFHLVLRSGTDANGPGTRTTDRIARYGPFRYRRPVPGCGISGACIFTLTLASPLVVPCDRHWSWGAELTNSSNWSADGMSCHTSFSRTNKNEQYCHMRSEAHGYFFQTGASVATRDVRDARTWRFRLGLSTARNILQLGSSSVTFPGSRPGQHYGMGGMFPAAGETLSARITGTRSGDSVLCFLSARTIPGVPLFPGTRLYLDTGILALINSATAGGAITTILLGRVPGTTRTFGPDPVQAVVVRGGRGLLTNVNATTILP